MKHIVFFSGGVGSYYAAKRVVEKHGKENTILLFTDTLMEDEDLYRFLNETSRHLGIEVTRIVDGRTPWDIFESEKFLGNSRWANCSKYLKQTMSRKWINKNHKPENCILYLGIDWTEEHRTKAPVKHWAPYKMEFPMCEEPYLTKNEMIEGLKVDGIEVPRLYKMGYAHNNCGGFCVRAGVGHFKHLYETQPDLYKWHEEKEQRVMEMILERTGEKRTILRRRRKGTQTYISLKELREEIETAPEQIDIFDIGGCGCFVDD
jgi:3'-phosphoadenosine 5'-phosphosulfate sulfotransferase (PAPS reductase)/FAD synthetase